MSRPRVLSALAGLLLLLGSAAGCGSSGTPRSAAPSPTAPAPTAPASPDGLRARCLSAMPDDAPLTDAWLPGPDGRSLRAGVFTAPGATTAMVLLHQTGSQGLCGWGRYATLAAGAGVSSVAIDLCGYGESSCTPDQESDATTQVDVAAAYARESLGATRVVVVGVSMGGSQAVRAVAGGAQVDAWVDVSGPDSWDGDDLVDLAGSLSPHGLVVMARSDGAQQYAAAKALARDARVPFVGARSGHGWELVTTLQGDLTPIGRRVLELVGGETPR